MIEQKKLEMQARELEARIAMDERKLQADMALAQQAAQQKAVQAEYGKPGVMQPV
jgi:hypothetical protein